MRIVFSYLQIDAMLKQLHINGLLLCSHTNIHFRSLSTYCILLRDLSEITTGGGVWTLEAPRVCHSLECKFIFCTSSKEGNGVLDFVNSYKNKFC